MDLRGAGISKAWSVTPVEIQAVTIEITTDQIHEVVDFQIEDDLPFGGNRDRNSAPRSSGPHFPTSRYFQTGTNVDR